MIRGWTAAHKVGLSGQRCVNANLVCTCDGRAAKTMLVEKSRVQSKPRVVGCRDVHGRLGGGMDEANRCLCSLLKPVPE